MDDGRRGGDLEGGIHFFFVVGREEENKRKGKS
jgi:hypothetical protein